MAWVWPTVCKTITQGYGRKNARYAKGYHTGIDIGCQNGSPIRSATDGTVTYAGWAGAYGNQIKVGVNSTTEIWYNHMSKLIASKGDKVTAGKEIGKLGTTGNSTGPHLHFEVRVNGKDVDPMPYLSGSKTVPAGDVAVDVSNPFSSIGKLGDFFKLLADPITWMRVGMVLGGGLLLIMAFVGLAKMKALGSTAIKAVKPNAQSGSTGTG
jgi:murein DD-endopeptidase MepM/ murein hydrolase activator NlpD